MANRNLLDSTSPGVQKGTSPINCPEKLRKQNMVGKWGILLIRQVVKLFVYCHRQHGLVNQSKLRHFDTSRLVSSNQSALLILVTFVELNLLLCQSAVWRDEIPVDSSSAAGCIWNFVCVSALSYWKGESVVKEGALGLIRNCNTIEKKSSKTKKPHAKLSKPIHFHIPVIKTLIDPIHWWQVKHTE